MENIVTILKVKCNACEVEFKKEYDGTLPECPACRSKLISIVAYEERKQKPESEQKPFLQTKQTSPKQTEEEQSPKPEQTEKENKESINIKIPNILKKLSLFGGGKDKTLKFKEIKI